LRDDREFTADACQNLPSNHRPQSPVRRTPSGTSRPYPWFANNTRRIASCLRSKGPDTKIPRKQKTEIINDCSVWPVITVKRRRRKMSNPYFSRRVNIDTDGVSFIYRILSNKIDRPDPTGTKCSRGANF